MRAIELITADEAFAYGDADVEFILRRIPEAVYQGIRARHTTTVRGADGLERTETDETAVDTDSLDYIVQSWTRGVTLPGQATLAPWTRETKAQLPRAIKRELIRLGFAALNTAGDEARALGNLPRSSAGAAGGSAPPTSPA